MADTPKRAKSSKKNRKYGRNAVSCLRYKNSHRREHNKLRRLKKHLKKCPNDATALAAVEICLVTIRGH